MKKLIIGIADDEKAVVTAYEIAIRKLGHTPVSNTSVRRMIDYIGQPNHNLDILFLDHHFHGEESGVSMIPKIKSLLPDVDIVVTTKQPLEPKFVQDIVDAGVGFFKKSIIDPVWLEMEISQRVNIKIAKFQEIQRRLQEFSNSLAESREGLWRFPFFSSAKKSKSISVKSIERLENRFVFPRFENFMTIHSGEVKEITQERTWEEEVAIKAGTSQEIGLKFSDSTKFLGTKLGIEIIGKIKAEQEVSIKTIVRGSLKVGQKIQILDSEHKTGVRRKDLFRGVVHSVFKVVVELGCTSCGTGAEFDIFILVPAEGIEVAVAYDKKGMIHNDEDGRRGYPVWGEW